jgi:hypothetical protein
MYNRLLVAEMCVCCDEKRKDENEDIRQQFLKHT